MAPTDPTGPLPGAVLFACNYNRVRSPMAEALTKLLYGQRIFVDSCGLKPGEGVDPFVCAVIDELGADLTRHTAKTFDEVDEGAYWPTHDPTLATGSREAVLEAYRAVRDELKARIEARFGRPSTFGG